MFIVNTDLAGDIEINGFADLLNPALKGKIAAGDPVNSSSAFQCLIALVSMTWAAATDVRRRVGLGGQAR